MTLLCNQFQCLSMSTLISLFILSPLLQFKPLFYLPSMTGTVRRLFLATEACVFENVPLHLPSGSEELWIPQLPLTGHTFPTALRHLDTPVLPAALCSASSMCCSELDTSFQLCLANMLQRGRVASHVLQDLLLFIHWNMTFFYIAWDCWLTFNLWSSRTAVPFPNWPGFQPHNLSCDTHSHPTAQTFLLSCALIFLMC